MINQTRREKNCVVQCRISSLKQQEGESLERQENGIRKYILDRNWNIVPGGKVWSTAISGRKTDREDFEEILGYIKLHPGLVDYYIFKSIDRATRAGSEEYSRMKRELAKYNVAMIDTNGVIQPSINTLEDVGQEYSWSRYHPSEITENILAINANQEVTGILTRMIGQEIRLTQQGYRARRPADGYINHKIFVEGKKKTIQIPDQDRAKYYIAMFELRAQGLSDIDVVKRVNAMGYRSAFQNRYDKEHKKIIGQTGGLLLTVKQFQHIIINTIYAGIICEKWTSYKPIKAQYDGLVSVETFNKANRGKLVITKNIDGSLELIKGYPFGKSGKERMKNNPLFPFKFILCPLCDKPFLGSSPVGKYKKKFPTYHCARGHKYFGVPKRDFEDSVKEYINSLKFTPGLLNGLEATFLSKFQKREKEIVRASGNIHQNIAELEIQQASKLEAFEATRSNVIREKLEKEIDLLEIQINEAGREREKIQITRDDIKLFMKEAKTIMEHPAKILLNIEDTMVQRDLFGLVFEKMPM
jgi:site-specific DNA recombinase